MKRSLLPLNALRVLDAAARHLSLPRAADELAVTPAAVGQQIRALEDLLGVLLFRRTPKGLELTREAAAGMAALRAGFTEFEQAVAAIQAGQGSDRLSIAVPRDVATKWLIPRLAAVRAALPDVAVTLVVTPGPVEFAEANLDLALGYGPPPSDLEHASLGSAAMVAIAPPGQDAQPLPLIRWADAAGGDPAAALLTVGDAGLAIDAVAAGLGQAVVPELLAAGDLAAGRVAATAITKPAADHGYWLGAPPPQWRQAKVRRLVAALLQDPAASTTAN